MSTRGELERKELDSRFQVSEPLKRGSRGHEGASRDQVLETRTLCPSEWIYGDRSCNKLNKRTREISQHDLYKRS